MFQPDVIDSALVGRRWQALLVTKDVDEAIRDLTTLRDGDPR